MQELGTEKRLCSDKLQESDGLVLYRGIIYIPCDSQLRLNIMKAHHNYLIAGHPSQWKMTELVTHNSCG